MPDYTVVNAQGKFVLNLLPSGILHPKVVCVLGDGMVVDLNHLSAEISQIEAQNISVSPKNLKLSKKPRYLCRGIKYRMNLRKTGFQKLVPLCFRLHKTRHRICLQRQIQKENARLGDLFTSR